MLPYNCVGGKWMAMNMKSDINWEYTYLYSYTKEVCEHYEHRQEQAHQYSTFPTTPPKSVFRVFSLSMNESGVENSCLHYYFVYIQGVCGWTVGHVVNGLSFSLHRLALLVVVDIIKCNNFSNAKRNFDDKYNFHCSRVVATHHPPSTLHDQRK